MFSIPALLLYILCLVIGWLIARWRGAQQKSEQLMAPSVSISEPEVTKLVATKPVATKPEVSSKSDTMLQNDKKTEQPSEEPSAPKKPAPEAVSQPIAKKATPKKKQKAAKPASKPIVSSDPDKPERLSGPRDGDADNLKRVKGIGPGNEKKLNAFGIYHFDQIANWSPEQAEWIGKELSFPGRIEREEWIEQGKVLASGGDTEFSKRADKR